MAQSEILVYVGTYASQEDEGIHVYRLDSDNGALESVGGTGGIANPSFLDLDPQGRVLCAISEVSQFEGQPAGAVSSFAIDPQTGELTFRSQRSSVGTGPCHVNIDATGRHALVANYGGGSVAVLPIGADGSLGEATDFIQHEGSSVDAQRQTSPRAHSINIAPDNRFALTPDLGLDRILIYQLDSSAGKLQPGEQPWASVAPGAGPRHLAFHPSRKYVYVITEMGNTVTAFAYDEPAGSLSEIQTITTLPEDYDGVSYTADIHVAPSGRFLYGSNRGHDSIVIYAIDEATGKLSTVGHEPTQGANPRNFALDPTGSFLFAASQNDDIIVAFRIDADGKLQATGQVTRVPKPVCIKMIQR